MELKYKRILLKISGEALMGKQDFGIDYEPVQMIAQLKFGQMTISTLFIKFCLISLLLQFFLFLQI